MAEANRMVIATRSGPDGLTEVWLERRGQALWLGEQPPGGAAPPPEVEVPGSAVLATFRRYGRAFELGLTPPPPAPGEPMIAIEHEGAVAALRGFRFRGFGDVIPSDYLVLTPAEGEPLVVPAGMAASALAVVARAAARARAQRAGQVAGGGA